MSEARTARLYVLVRPSEKEEIAEAAKRDDRTISDWVRLVALESARKLRDSDRDRRRG